MTPQFDAAPGIARLLAAANRFGTYAIEAFPRGRNNRLYLAHAGSETYVAKFYFRDGRDRLTHEVAFLQHAKRLQIERVPRLIAFDAENNCSLLTFVRGRLIVPEELSERLVQQGIDFAIALNKSGTGRERLPTASEACFSIAEHLTLVERRIADLEANAFEANVKRFVREELAAAWRKCRHAVETQAGSRATAKLSDTDRFVSPSDFGFHNALLDGDGHIVFFDFEYAGIDDPAKLLCDFFCQVEIPVPIIYMPAFVSQMASLTTDRAWFENRCHLLMPVYRFKWAAIVLSEFLPSYAARMQFAGSLPPAARAATQITKARRLLNAVLEDWPG